MKSTQILPTKDNIYDSIQKDIFRRNEQVYYFASLLSNVDGPYTFAINARWGDGKTFFVKQTQMLLEACNPHADSLSNDEKISIKAAFQNSIHDSGACSYIQPQMTVYYDAWLCDNDTDPILSLLYETAVQSAESFAKDMGDGKSKFINVMNLCSGIVDLIPGINTSSLAAAIKDLAAKEDPLSEIKKQRDLRESIIEFFANILIEQGNRLVIFVDELDRCKPDYAVRFLERIKHYFAIDNVTFVFSVNVTELCHTINRFYGEGFNSTQYLTRFFDYIIDLPSPELGELYNQLGIRTMYSFEATCKAVIDYYHFSLRDLAQYYKRCRIAAYKKTHNSESAYGDGALNGLYVLVPIMIGLELHDHFAYRNFIEGRDPSPLVEIVGDGYFLGFFFNALLAGNETYKDDESGKVHVSRKQKLIDYYNAIFVEDYSKDVYVNRIGTLECDKTTKSFLLKAASGLTRFVDWT